MSDDKTIKSRIVETLNVKEDQLLEMMAELGLTEDDSDAFYMKMSEKEWNECQHIRSAVQYLGFDAKKIVNAFFQKARMSPPPADAKPKTFKGANGTFDLYENYTDKNTDLKFFLLVFLERGNNITKASTRCEQEIGVLITRKAALYGIITDPRQQRSILGTSELSLARLAQAFALCTSTLILANKIDGKLKSKVFVRLPRLID